MAAIVTMASTIQISSVTPTAIANGSKIVLKGTNFNAPNLTVTAAANCAVQNFNVTSNTDTVINAVAILPDAIDPATIFNGKQVVIFVCNDNGYSNGFNCDVDPSKLVTPAVE